MQDDGGAEFLAIADLNERRVFRHHDRRRNAEQFSLVGERLGVIARGGRDHAAFLLVGRQLRESVARAAFLETAGALQVVELAENFHPGDLAQRNRRLAGRIIDRAFDSLPRLFDVFERDHALFNIPCPEERQCFRMERAAIPPSRRRPFQLPNESFSRNQRFANFHVASCSGSNGFGRKNIPWSRRSPG